MYRFYLIILFFKRDPRFTNETLGFLQIIAQNAPPPGSTIEVARMRHMIEDLHQKGNAKLNETFKGTLEEKIVKANSTGRYSTSNIILS